VNQASASVSRREGRQRAGERAFVADVSIWIGRRSPGGKCEIEGHIDVR
jgi:hypothetical protein